MKPSWFEVCLSVCLFVNAGVGGRITPIQELRENNFVT